MKNRLFLISLSLILTTSLCACTINLTPDPVLEPDSLKVTSSEDAIPEADTTDGKDTDSDVDNPEISNSAPEENKTFSISKEWGLKMDNAVYAEDITGEEHDEIVLYYLAGNLYYEKITYFEDCVMSWSAAEVNLISEPEENGDELSFDANILRFSSFSYAGEYWDDGVDAEITFSKNSLKIDFSEDSDSFEGTLQTPGTLFHDPAVSYGVLEDIYVDLYPNDYMELYGEWYNENDGSFHYVRINKDDTMVFLSKEEGRPVSITFCSYAKFFNGDSFFFAMVGEQFGYTEISDPSEFWMEVVGKNNADCLRMTIYPIYDDTEIINEYYNF